MPTAEASQSSTPAPPDAAGGALHAPHAASATTPSLLGKKRKRAVKNETTGSPAPQDGAETPQATVEQLGSSSHFDPSKPIPTEAPKPIFLPVPASDLFLTDGLAMNKQRYRYTDAVEVAPFVFHSQQSPPADTVHVCWEDRSPLMRVSQDGLTLGGDRGFRSARLNVPIREGKWYVEVTIERGGGDDRLELGRADGSHVRLGWARREAPLNGPVGLDGYSYGYRDKTGQKFTLSRPKDYGKPFQTGDVVGMYISLPPARQPNHADPHDPAHIKRKRQAVGIRGRVYHESVEYGPCKEMIDLLERPTATNVKRGPQARPAGVLEDDAEGNEGPGPSDARTPRTSPTKASATVKNLPGSRKKSEKTEGEERDRPLITLGRESRIAFFVNGECQGTAFRDIFDYRPLRLTSAQRKAKEKEKKGTFKERENSFDDGTLGYYPFISLHNSGRVRINAGPDFAFPPPTDIDAVCDAMAVEGATAEEAANAVNQRDLKRQWRPLCDRYGEFWEEVKAADLVDDDLQKNLVDALRREEERKHGDDDKKVAAKERRRLMDQARRARNKGKAGPDSAKQSEKGSMPPDDKMAVAAPEPRPITPLPEPVKVRFPSSAPLQPTAIRPLQHAAPQDNYMHTFQTHPQVPVPRAPQQSASPQMSSFRFSPQSQRPGQPSTPVDHGIRFAPPYAYPGVSGASPSVSPTFGQRPNSGSRGNQLKHMFDSPPARGPELPPRASDYPPPPRSAGSSFDPIRSAASEQASQHQHHSQQQYQQQQQQQQQLQHQQGRMSVNSLMIDTGPRGFHPQWTEQQQPRPTSSSSAAPHRFPGFSHLEQQQQQHQPIHAAATPLRSSFIQPREQPAPPPAAAQRTSPTRPVYSPEDLRVGPSPPISAPSFATRPSLLSSFSTGPLSPSVTYAQSSLRGGPSSPIAYTESSLRSGARGDDDEEQEEDFSAGPRRPTLGVGYSFWDSVGRQKREQERDRDGDSHMRDER